MKKIPEFYWLRNLDAIPELRDRWLRDSMGIPFDLAENETARDKYAREAEVRRIGEMVLAAVFVRLKENIGVAGASEMFSRHATKVPKRKSGEHGARNEKINADILQMYEISCENSQEKSKVPRALSEYLHYNFPGKYGLSASAIEKQIRPLAAERKHERERQERARRQLEKEMQMVREKFLQGGGQKVADHVVMIDGTDIEGQEP